MKMVQWITLVLLGLLSVGSLSDDVKLEELEPEVADFQFVDSEVEYGVEGVIRGCPCHSCETRGSSREGKHEFTQDRTLLRRSQDLNLAGTSPSFCVASVDRPERAKRVSPVVEQLAEKDLLGPGTARLSPKLRVSYWVELEEVCSGLPSRQYEIKELYLTHNSIVDWSAEVQVGKSSRHYKDHEKQMINYLIALQNIYHSFNLPKRLSMGCGEAQSPLNRIQEELVRTQKARAAQAKKVFTQCISDFDSRKDSTACVVLTSGPW